MEELAAGLAELQGDHFVPPAGVPQPRSRPIQQTLVPGRDFKQP